MMDDDSCTLLKDLRVMVHRELGLCVECNRCINVCPVTKREVSAGILNKAICENRYNTDVKRFIYYCVQCQRCVPVCPKHLHRDKMILLSRYHLRHEAPYPYRRYNLVRGSDLKPLARVLQSLYIMFKRMLNRDIAEYMDTSSSKRSSLLFYPGCYVYSPGTIRLTRRILDYINVDYTILGGLKVCCGLPHMLSGDFTRAEKQMHRLQEKIKMINPLVIITGCNECLEVLSIIKKRYSMSYESCSILEYLERYHADKFPDVKIRDKVTIHDSCRNSRYYKHDDITRRSARRFSTINEMAHTGEMTLCCYHWNHDYDPFNHERRRERLKDAKKHASTMICDCVTCFEEYKHVSDEVEVIDVLELYAEAIDAANK